MDRPDAVGHFGGQCGVSPSAQGRHAGIEGRGAPRSGAGGATRRSIRGHRAGHFVGGASEAAYLGRQCAVRAGAVSAPFARWLLAIARNKLIDSLRRRGRRVFVNIDDFAETIPGEPAAETASANGTAAQLQPLRARQRDVLQAIAVDSASIKDTAAKFAMSEGAVRVALHRGLASLTAKLREQ